MSFQKKLVINYFECAYNQLIIIHEVKVTGGLSDLITSCFDVLQGHDIYGFDLDLMLHRINACKVCTAILVGFLNVNALFIV